MEEKSPIIYQEQLKEFAQKIFANIESKLGLKEINSTLSHKWIKINNSSQPYAEWKIKTLNWIENETRQRLAIAEKESRHLPTIFTESPYEATSGLEERLKQIGIYSRLALYIYMNIQLQIVSMSRQWGKSPIMPVDNMTIISIGSGKNILIPGKAVALKEFIEQLPEEEIFDELMFRGREMGVDRFILLDRFGAEYCTPSLDREKSMPLDFHDMDYNDMDYNYEKGRVDDWADDIYDDNHGYKLEKNRALSFIPKDRREEVLQNEEMYI